MLVLSVVGASGMQIGGYSVVPAIGLATVVPGSYFPDIDIHRSRLGQRHKFVSKHLKHRGITHTLLGPLILSAVFYFVLRCGIPVLAELVGGFTLGWTVHIVADMFNKKGVPLLWPVYTHRIHIASVLTGSWQERVFAAFWIGVNMLCLCFLLR